MLSTVWELYVLEGYEAKGIERDFEARNAIYCCEKESESAKILRISYLNDRSREELLAEAEYIRYLFKHDGNVSIDLETGQITVYDFDDSCFGWYMYDLAFNWMYAVGWTQWEKDPAKRKEYMDNFFKTVLEFLCP